LTKPFEVFTEMARVTKPGGLGICAFSNRMFPTKAVSLWTSTDDADHARIVGSFFHYSSAEWEAAEVRDITRANIFGSSGDPMYVVFARKKK
jgi:ubiquinone/menaquinone biosynthesis C-methylase UbiE